jgi:hypothetical protein
VVGSYLLAEEVSKRRRRRGGRVVAGPGRVSQSAEVSKPVALVAEEIAPADALEGVEPPARVGS